MIALYAFAIGVLGLLGRWALLRHRMRAQPRSSKNRERLTPIEEKILRRGRCPDCGRDKFREGPSGGMSLNIECAGCGSRFNVDPVFTPERISDRSPGRPRPPTRPAAQPPAGGITAAARIEQARVEVAQAGVEWERAKAGLAAAAGTSSLARLKQLADAAQAAGLGAEPMKPEPAPSENDPRKIRF